MSFNFRVDTWSLLKCMWGMCKLLKHPRLSEIFLKIILVYWGLKAISGKGRRIKPKYFKTSVIILWYDSGALIPPRQSLHCFTELMFCRFHPQYDYNALLSKSCPYVENVEKETFFGLLGISNEGGWDSHLICPSSHKINISYFSFDGEWEF